MLVIDNAWPHGSRIVVSRVGVTCRSKWARNGTAVVRKQIWSSTSSIEAFETKGFCKHSGKFAGRTLCQRGL